MAANVNRFVAPELPPIPDVLDDNCRYLYACLVGKYSKAIEDLFGDEFGKHSEDQVTAALEAAALRLYWEAVFGAAEKASKAGHSDVAEYLGERFKLPACVAASAPACTARMAGVARDLVRTKIKSQDFEAALQIAATAGILDGAEKAADAIVARLSDAITRAVRKGRLDLATYLIDLFQVPAANNWLGAAVKACDIESIRHFAGMGCVLAYGYYGAEQDFKRACRGGKAEVVEYLMGRGCCREIFGSGGFLAEAILAAFQGGHSELASALYGQAKGDADTDKLAARMIKEANDHPYGWRTDGPDSMLVTILKFLTSDGRTINDEAATNAFSLACARSDMPAFELLLEHGVNPLADGQRDFQAAVKDGRVAVVARLLELGADPAAKSNEAIAVAACNGRAEVVEMLLADPRVDPAARDSLAIRWASTYGHTEVVNALLADGRSDPAAANNNALKMAEKRGHFKIVALLREAGVE
jgi:hypothetical protein